MSSSALRLTPLSTCSPTAPIRIKRTSMTRNAAITVIRAAYWPGPGGRLMPSTSCPAELRSLVRMPRSLAHSMARIVRTLKGLVKVPE